MATNAKIIKLGNSTTTYIPITSTEAIQHSYGSQKVVLESYLGGLQAGIAKNATNISTLAGAALLSSRNIDDECEQRDAFQVSDCIKGKITVQRCGLCKIKSD